MRILSKMINTGRSPGKIIVLGMLCIVHRARGAKDDEKIQRPRSGSTLPRSTNSGGAKPFFIPKVKIPGRGASPSPGLSSSSSGSPYSGPKLGLESSKKDFSPEIMHNMDLNTLERIFPKEFRMFDKKKVPNKDGTGWELNHEGLPKKVKNPPYSIKTCVHAQFEKLRCAVESGEVNRICFVDGDGNISKVFDKKRSPSIFARGEIPVVDECPKTFFIVLAHRGSMGRMYLTENFKMQDIKSLANHERVWLNLGFVPEDEIVDYRLYAVGALIKSMSLFDNVKSLVISSDHFMICGRGLPKTKNAPFTMSLVEFMGSTRRADCASLEWYKNAISVYTGKKNEFLNGGAFDVEKLIRVINEREKDEYHLNNLRREFDDLNSLEKTLRPRDVTTNRYKVQKIVHGYARKGKIDKLNTPMARKRAEQLSRSSTKAAQFEMYTTMRAAKQNLTPPKSPEKVGPRGFISPAAGGSSGSPSPTTSLDEKSDEGSPEVRQLASNFLGLRRHASLGSHKQSKSPKPPRQGTFFSPKAESPSSSGSPSLRSSRVSPKVPVKKGLSHARKMPRMKRRFSLGSDPRQRPNYRK